jgi:hypothetical protein
MYSCVQIYGSIWATLWNHGSRLPRSIIEPAPLSPKTRSSPESFPTVFRSLTGTGPLYLRGARVRASKSEGRGTSLPILLSSSSLFPFFQVNWGYF